MPYSDTYLPSDWDASYQNWPALVVDNIAAPLGMTSTQVDCSNVSGQVAQGYAYSDSGGSPASVFPKPSPIPQCP